MSDSLSSLPTVKPIDIIWLSAARPLLRIPSGTMIVVSTVSPPPPELERWLAFFAAAVAFGADWGTRRGAVRQLAMQWESVRIEVISAFDRLAVVCTTKSLESIELERLLETGIDFADRYSIAWAAAAHALQVLEAD